MISKL